MNWKITNNKNISSRPNQKSVLMLENEEKKLQQQKNNPTKEDNQLTKKQSKAPLKNEKQQIKIISQIPTQNFVKYNCINTSQKIFKYHNRLSKAQVMSKNIPSQDKIKYKAPVKNQNLNPNLIPSQSLHQVLQEQQKKLQINKILQKEEQEQIKKKQQKTPIKDKKQQFKQISQETAQVSFKWNYVYVPKKSFNFSMPSKTPPKLMQKNITQYKQGQYPEFSVPQIFYERKQKLQQLEKQQKQLRKKQVMLEEEKKKYTEPQVQIKKKLEKNEKIIQKQITSKNFLQLELSLLEIKFRQSELKRLKNNRFMEISERGQIEKLYLRRLQLNQAELGELQKKKLQTIDRQFQTKTEIFLSNLNKSRQISISDKKLLMKEWEATNEIQKMQEQCNIIVKRKNKEIQNQKQQLKRLKKQMQNQQYAEQKNKITSKINQKKSLIKELEKNYQNIKSNFRKKVQAREIQRQIQRDQKGEEMKRFQNKINQKYQKEKELGLQRINQEKQKIRQSVKQTYQKQKNYYNTINQKITTQISNCYQIGIRNKWNKDFDFQKTRFYSDDMPYKPSEIQFMKNQFNSINTFLKNLEENNKSLSEKLNEMKSTNNALISCSERLTQIKKEKAVINNQNQKQKVNLQFY